MPPGLPGPEPSKDAVQAVGEQVLTQLLAMASANPQLLLGLSLAGAAREVSQLTGLTRRRQQRGAAMPPAAALLSGNVGDLDRLLALQTMLAGGPGNAPLPLGAPPPALAPAPPSPVLAGAGGAAPPLPGLLALLAPQAGGLV